MSRSVLMDEVSPSRLKRPKGIVACSLEGTSQLRWCEVGLVVVGWVEKARVS